MSAKEPLARHRRALDDCVRRSWTLTPNSGQGTRDLAYDARPVLAHELELEANPDGRPSGHRPVGYRRPLTARPRDRRAWEAHRSSPLERDPQAHAPGRRPRNGPASRAMLTLIPAAQHGPKSTQPRLRPDPGRSSPMTVSTSTRAIRLSFPLGETHGCLAIQESENLPGF